jgi:hypothetical protein
MEDIPTLVVHTETSLAFAPAGGTPSVPFAVAVPLTGGSSASSCTASDSYTWVGHMTSCKAPEIH